MHKKNKKTPPLHEVSCISKEEAKENREKLQEIYKNMPKVEEKLI